MALTFIYFLVDITSLPQDIYYIWATTSPDLNLEDSLTQLIGFSLALANIVGVFGVNGLIFLQNMDPGTNTNTDYSFLIFLPQTISMLGSISYAIFIALN